MRLASIVALLSAACVETSPPPNFGSGGAGGSTPIDAPVVDAPMSDGSMHMPDGAPPQTPRSRGLWIWSMQGRADPASVVAANAQRWGIKFVVIQASQQPGNSVWTEN